MRNSRLSAPTACIRAQIVQHALLHSLALAPCGSRDRPHTTAGVSFLGVRKLLLTDLPADILTDGHTEHDTNRSCTTHGVGTHGNRCGLPTVGPEDVINCYPSSPLGYGSGFKATGTDSSAAPSHPHWR